MFLSIIRYIKGYVKIRISGCSTERFLNACSNKGIYIWKLYPVAGAYEMCISIRGFRKLKPIIKKTGTKVAVKGRFGLPFFLHRYRKRKLFFIGAALCVTIIYLLSLHIWNIDIRGNLARTDETIIEYLETKNVEHGIKKSKVDCARIVKDIRKQFDDIIWVSASIEGTRLIIQVKENEDSLPVVQETQEGNDEPLDIVANQDCVITEIITRNGVPAVKEGDSVKKGDILVCGRVPVNNDAGETTAYQYHQSDADIRGQTTIPYENEQSLTYTKKELSDIKKEELFIRVGKYRLGLGNRQHDYHHYEVSSWEKQWKIGASFYLPVSIGKRTIRPYNAEEVLYDKETLQELLSRKFNRFCEDLQKKGVEIIQNDVKIYTGSDKASAKGSLTVIMPVGETAPTEKLTIPAKENEMSGENIDGNDGNNN